MVALSFVRVLAASLFFALPAPCAARIAGAYVTGDARVHMAPSVSFGFDAQEAAVLVGDTESFQLRRGQSASADAIKLALSPAITRLTDTVVDGDLAIDSLSIGGTKQWALWDLDTFDVQDSGQWSLNDHSSCGVGSGPGRDEFLGGHCRFAASTSTRRYTQLPPHERIRIRARVHFIDEWEGESIQMSLDGAPVWSQAHEWCPNFQKWICTKYGIDTCGRETPDRLSVVAEATSIHNASEVSVAFSSSLPPGTDACRTAWGVDDVSVELL